MAGWGLKLLCKFQATKNSAIDSYTVLIEFHIMQLLVVSVKYTETEYCMMFTLTILYNGILLDSIQWFYVLHSTMTRYMYMSPLDRVYYSTIILFHSSWLYTSSYHASTQVHMQYLTLLNPSSLYQKSLSFMQHNSMTHHDVSYVQNIVRSKSNVFYREKVRKKIHHKIFFSNMILSNPSGGG